VCRRVVDDNVVRRRLFRRHLFVDHRSFCFAFVSRGFENF